MYLNTFKQKEVTEVIDQLYYEDPDLICITFDSVNVVKELKKKEYLKLMYDESFHRLVLSEMKLSEPMFVNPTYEAKLCPKDVFIVKVRGANLEKFNKLMNS